MKSKTFRERVASLAHSRDAATPARPLATFSAVMVLSLAASVPRLHAATFIWDGGGVEAKASTKENWDGDALPAPANFDLIFSAGSASGTGILWDYAQNFRSLTFDASAPAYTFSGTTPIQFITSGIDALINTSAAPQTLTSPVNVFFNGTKTFNAATAPLNLSTVNFRGDSMTAGQTNALALSGDFGGSISGLIADANLIAGTSNSLVKNGLGTWLLSGANTFTGSVIVNDGTLKAGLASTATSGPFGRNTAVTLADSPTAILDLNGFDTQIGSLSGGGPAGGNLAAGTASLTFGGGSFGTYAGILSGSAPVTKNGTGIQAFSGANLWTGGTNINAGGITFLTTSSMPPAGTVTVAAGATFGMGVSESGPPFYSPSQVALAFAGTLPNVTSDLTSLVGIDTTAGDLSLNSLAASTRGLSKSGPGTLTLTGSQLYTGPTTATGSGPLVLSSTGTASSGILMNAGTGATIRVTTPAATGSGNITFATGAVTPILQFHIDGGGTQTLPNALSSNSGVNPIIDVNNNGDGSINGVIQLNGTLAASAIGTSTFNVTGANGYSLLIANLRSTAGTPGAIVFAPTSAALTLGNLSGSQASGTNTWTLGGTNPGNTVTGIISNGGSGTLAGALTKNSTGTWVLTGANTYTGKTIIQQGTLSVNSLNNVAGGTASSSLGAPVTVPLGTIDIGSAGNTGTLLWTGSTTETTDRVINLSGSTGGATVNQSGTAPLKFISNFTATGIRDKTLTLTGSTTGTGEIAGAIVNNTSGQTQNTTAYALGATSIILSSVTGIATGATITGTGIPAGTTITAITAATKTITLSAPTTAAGATFQNLTIPGVVNLTGVTKTGTGAWTLSGTNTYTGTTTVSDGGLTLSGNRTAPAPIIVGNAATVTAGGTAVLNIQGNFALGANSFNTATGGSTAIVNHTAGSLSAVGGNQLLISNGAGNATYNLSGGSYTGNAAGIRIGVNNIATPGLGFGTFNLSGTGTITSALQIGRSDAKSDNTDNTFNQTGGTATVSTLALGGASAGSAGTINTLTLTGGTFTAIAFGNAAFTSGISAGDSNQSTITIGGTALVTLPAFPTGRPTSPVTPGIGSTATLILDGGTLIPAAASTGYLNGLTNAFLTANGAKIEVPAGRDISIGQVLENAPATTGTLTKSGAGTLTLTAPNTYTGNTSVTEGTLSLTSPALADTSTLTIGTTIGSTAILDLPSPGTDTVASLIIDGAAQPAGLYDSTNTSGAITGLGKIQVAGTGASYSAWAAAFTSPALSAPAPGADPDADGLTNAIEYVLGTDPRFTTPSSAAPTASVSSGVLTYNFNRVDSSETPDVTTLVQVSTDLTDWTTLPAYTIRATTATSSAGVTIAENGVAPDLITVTLPDTGAARKFTRLKVGTTP